MTRSLSSSLIAGFSHLGASLLLLISGGLLWQSVPLSWRWFSTIAHAPVDFCPDRSDSLPLAIEQYQQLEKTSVYGSTPETIHNLLGQPTCLLPPIAIRADAVTEREVYYLPDGVAVVLAYEAGTLVGYSQDGQSLPDRISVAQSWAITPGDRIAGYPVLASLGELSIQVQGFVYAPAQGILTREVTWLVPDPSDTLTPQGIPPDCVLFSSAAFPAYLSRLCGLGQYQLNTIATGEHLGRVGGLLHLALLTLRPTQTQELRWHYVAPAPQFIAQFF